MRLLLLLVLTVLAVLPASVVALEDIPGPIEPQPVCPPLPESDRLIFRAPTIDEVGTLTSATGGVLFLDGKRRITASDAWYNSATREGVMHNVELTTCTKEHSHFHLVAKEVTLLAGNRLHARRASLYVGNFRVLTVPSLKMEVGGTASSTSVFPRPSYDRRDGVTLSQSLRLVDTFRARTTLDATLTTRHGIMADLGSVYGLDGTLQHFPGRSLSYDSLRSQLTTLPQEPAGPPCDPQSLRPVGAARLRAFGRLTLRQRTFDIRNPGLVVSRQPELGLTYFGPQLSVTRQRLDPRIEMHSQLYTSWGRFKETPGNDAFTQRTSVGGVAALNFLPLGESTSLQPVFSYRTSAYGGGDDYRMWAYAIDACHLFPNGSFVGARYIQRSDSGETPFLFDRLDISREYQGAFQVVSGDNSYGLVMRYNADQNALYEWDLMYSHRTDCTATWVTYNSRLKRLSFNVSLINM